MKRQLDTLSLLLVCPLILILSSCSTLTPHENFKAQREFNIGSSIDKPRVAGVALAKYLVQSKSLPNGNIENEYLGRGSCRYFFEFDPGTRIIVDWRFEGTEEDCVVVP